MDINYRPWIIEQTSGTHINIYTHARWYTRWSNRMEPIEKQQHFHSNATKPKMKNEKMAYKYINVL